MNKTKIIVSVILLSIITNLILITGFYYFLNNYGILNIDDSLSGEVTKIIKRNVITSNINEKIEIYDIENSVIKAIDKASPSVVSIVITKDLKVYYEDPYSFFGGYVTQEKQQVGGGSGIIITSDGYVMTNKHVVQDSRADYSVVTNEGDTYTVDKIRLDPILDIAVLKIVDKNGKVPTNLKNATINSFKSEPKIGQFTIAIGNALAQFKDSATFGILSGKGRSLEQGNQNSTYIGLYQTDAPINPGNSGGPLLDINGNVIGVNTAITSVGQGIGFAIPVNKEFIDSTLKSIEKNGKIERPYIGVLYIELNKGIAKSLNLDKFQGVYIKEVLKNSPAMIGGLKQGDIIRKINSEEIKENESFFYKLLTLDVGEEIELTIYNNGQHRKTKIILGKR